MRDDRTCVWVTGASGFVGGAVVIALAERLGWDARRVVPVVRHAASWAGDGLVPLVWDPRSEPGAEVLRERTPTIVLHLAAERPASFAAEEVERVAEHNLAIDRAVFALAARVSARVVYASGCSVYPGRSVERVDEQAPCEPLGPYPAEKLHAEALGLEHEAAGRFVFTSLRVSAPYGPRQKARTVLQQFVRRALRGEDLTFHGSGAREQDFVHVRDVAEAFVLAAFAEAPDARGIFHVASGQPITMRALAELVVAQVPGTTSRVRASGEPDPQETFRARYSIERAREVLGFAPTTKLADGLRECLAAAAEET